MAPTLLFMLLPIINNACNLTSATRFRDKRLPNISSILIFGDSTVDTGNNNYIATIFKGDHLPYGQDFPDQIPTGRFSNGRLIPDFVASFLGIKQHVPPFLDPSLSNHDLLTGVSFASAGSGYDDLTTVVTAAIPVTKQLDHFRRYKEKLRSFLGRKGATDLIKKSLVIISAGTNDFGFNYYLLPLRRTQYDARGYQDYLQNAIQRFVRELYNHGCRRMVITGLPPMGCLPILITARLKPLLDRTCLDDQNEVAVSYNQKLVKLLPRLQASLPESRMVYADVYEPLMDMVERPQEYGFTTTNRGCCGTGFLESSYLCNQLTPACETPSEFLFWDSIHPSEAAYKAMAGILIKQLVKRFLF